MAVKITVGEKEYIIGQEYEFSDILQEDKSFEVKWYKGVLKGYCPHPNSANSFVCGSQYYVHCREKVEELDYEILSLSGKDGNVIHKVNYSFTECFQTLVNEKDTFSIHSVKRLLDGEVFTIGDVVDGFSYKNRAIEEFKLSFNRIYIKQIGGHSDFDDIKKVKKTPLFTTEDGVAIFEGDDFSVVQLKTFQIINECKYPLTNPLNWACFSSEEKAQEYVLLNKPMLSLQDLLNVWGVSDEIGAYKTSLMFNKFEKLAKSKL